MLKLNVKVKLLPIDLKSRIFSVDRDSTTAHQRLLDKSIVKLKQFSRPRMFTNFHVDWKIFKHRRRTRRHDKSNRELLRIVDVYDTEQRNTFCPTTRDANTKSLGRKHFLTTSTMNDKWRLSDEFYETTVWLDGGQRSTRTIWDRRGHTFIAWN